MSYPPFGLFSSYKIYNRAMKVYLPIPMYNMIGE